MLSTDHIVSQLIKRERDWQTRCAFKHLPPEIFLAAYVEEAQPLVAKWLARHRYKFRVWPNGKIEFSHGRTILATLDPVQYSTPLSAPNYYGYGFADIGRP